MSDQYSEGETSGPAVQRRRPRWRTVIAAGLLAAAAFGVLASTSAGHRMLARIPGMEAVAAPFEGWRDGMLDGLVEGVVAARADRAVRHVAIEIDATAEQQEKLRAIVRDAVKDLLPYREKVMAARTAARDLLTRDTVDRAAIEKFRTDMLATHDAVSRRLTQAVADAAEVLTPEQRRKIADMVAAHHARWGGHRWGGWHH
jgi:Spy/CpxP family protein refolding chaperone